MTYEGVNPEQIEEFDKILEIYKTSGTEDAARFAVNLYKKAAEYEDIPPHNFIMLYTVLRNKEQLIDTLERCYQERYQPIVVLKVDPRLDFIRSEPRFKALLKKVGLD